VIALVLLACTASPSVRPPEPIAAAHQGRIDDDRVVWSSVILLDHAGGGPVALAIEVPEQVVLVDSEPPGLTLSRRDAGPAEPATTLVDVPRGAAQITLVVQEPRGAVLHPMLVDAPQRVAIRNGDLEPDPRLDVVPRVGFRAQRGFALKDRKLVRKLVPAGWRTGESIYLDSDPLVGAIDGLPATVTVRGDRRDGNALPLAVGFGGMLVGLGAVAALSARSARRGAPPAGADPVA
jgi:hypothetical protein